MARNLYKTCKILTYFWLILLGLVILDSDIIGNIGHLEAQCQTESVSTLP